MADGYYLKKELEEGISFLNATMFSTKIMTSDYSVGEEHERRNLSTESWFDRWGSYTLFNCLCLFAFKNRQCLFPQLVS